MKRFNWFLMLMTAFTLSFVACTDPNEEDKPQDNPQDNPQVASGKPLSNQGEFWLYQKISTALHKSV